MATPTTALAPPNPNPIPDDPPPPEPKVPESEQPFPTTSVEPTPSGDEESDDSSSVSFASSAPTAVAAAGGGIQRFYHAAKDLLHISFNQDYGCFAAGTKSGFRIYNCNPFREIFCRDLGGAGDDSEGGGIGVMEMLFRCNILALVGSGDAPYYPPNKVMIWDDHQSRCIGKLSFRSPVRGVCLRHDRIVVVQDPGRPCLNAALEC